MKRLVSIVMILSFFLLAWGDIANAEQPSADVMTLSFEIAALNNFHGIYNKYPNANIKSVNVYSLPPNVQVTCRFYNQGKQYTKVLTEDTPFIQVVFAVTNRYGASTEMVNISWIRSYDRIQTFTREDWTDVFQYAIVVPDGMSSESYAYAMFHAVKTDEPPFCKSTLNLDYLEFRYNNGGDWW